MINGVEKRKSLHTKNKSIAQKLYDQWIYQYQENKIKGSNFIPLISVEQKEIDLNRLPLKQAFREHLRVSKGNFVIGSIKIKELLLEHLNTENIQWDDINPERMLDFQEKLRLNYAPSTVDKFITHIKAFLKFAVKRNYFDEHDRVRLDFYKRSKPKKPQKLITDNDLHTMLKYYSHK